MGNKSHKCDNHVAEMNKQLLKINGLMECIAEKASNIELRQSHSSGEANDSVRAVQQWSTGESSCLPRAAIKKIIEELKQHGRATYYENFVQKDLRRCEFQVFIFYEICIKESGYCIAEAQHSHGECFLFMPSVRKVMQSEAGEDLKLQPLPEALELLYKLVKPMGRSFKPTSLQEMIEHRTVPKDYKGFADIDEATAKAIWSDIVFKYPKAKILEDVPLDAIKVAKFSWHDKLLAKIHEYNEHQKCVAFAVETIETDEMYGQQVSEEVAKKSAAEHTKRSDKFWSERDPAGAFKIERGARIEKKWAEEQKAKKAKTDETQPETENNES